MTSQDRIPGDRQGYSTGSGCLAHLRLAWPQYPLRSASMRSRHRSCCHAVWALLGIPRSPSCSFSLASISGRSGSPEQGSQSRYGWLPIRLKQRTGNSIRPKRRGLGDKPTRHRLVGLGPTTGHRVRSMRGPDPVRPHTSPWLANSLRKPAWAFRPECNPTRERLQDRWACDLR